MSSVTNNEKVTVAYFFTIARKSIPFAFISMAIDRMRSRKFTGISFSKLLGTGTGKTIAYAVAAIPVARALNKRLVVATATIALQEQFVNKDLPDIRRHTGLDFSFTRAKGRRRYVCLSKLDRVFGQGQGAGAQASSRVHVHAPRVL